MKPKHTTSIRSSLAALVAACLIPAMLFTAVLFYYDYQGERARIQQDLLASARAMVLAVDREFEGVDMSLRALATSPALAQKNLQAFHAQASQALVGHYVNNFVLIDASGQERLNTARGFGQTLPKATNLTQLERVLSSGRKDVSDLFLAPLPNRLAINVAIPVRLDIGPGAGATHSLVGVVLPEHFQERLRALRLPPDRIAVIADASAKVVARTHEPDRFIGKSVTPGLAQRLKESDQGTFEVVTLEGLPSLTAYFRSPVSGWTVAIGAPIDSLTADLRRSLWLLTGFAILLLAVSLGLAWALGSRIARAVRALGPAAEQLGYGQAVVVPALPILEVDEVAKAITKASAILAQVGEDLKVSEARMRGIVESAMDAIITVNADQRIVLYNRAAERIFGWPGEQVLGKRLEMLMPERFRAGHAAHVEQFSARGTTSRSMGDGTLIYGQRASGEEFPLEASISQLDTAGGKVFSVILRDVTARVRTHDALERSNLDLQQFAYVASHDLKTPLRSIGGFVQILERNYGDRLDEKALALIRRTSDAVRRLEHLTEDLLSYARVNSEMKTFAPVDCGEVVTEVIHLLNAAIEDTGAVVTAGALPVVMGDRTQLVQLFLNLVGNGIKYCRGRAPVVHVSARKGDREWVLSVADNGIGVEAKHHDKIFEVFKRLHTQKEYAGTGIGLAVCRRVVERHGGRIGITSVPGEGSTFTFTLNETYAESRVP